MRRPKAGRLAIAITLVAGAVAYLVFAATRDNLTYYYEIDELKAATASPGEKIRLSRSRVLPHVRLECCESCGHYLKSVDLRRESAAVPFVDEIAAAELDRQAKDEGFAKFEPNLAGL